MRSTKTLPFRYHFQSIVMPPDEKRRSFSRVVVIPRLPFAWLRACKSISSQYTRTHTLNSTSPESIFILMLILSIELSCLCFESYPSSKHLLVVSPQPANSAKFRSMNPNFWNDFPPFNSCNKKNADDIISRYFDIRSSNLCKKERLKKTRVLQKSRNRKSCFLRFSWNGDPAL